MSILTASTDQLAAPAAVAKSKAAPKRSPASKLIGVTINPARTRRYLDGLNLNKAVNDALEPIAAAIAEHDGAVSSLESGTKVVVSVNKVVTQHTVTETVDGAAVEKVVEKTKNETVSETVPLTAEDRTRLTAVVASYKDKIAKLRADAAALSSSRIRFSRDAPLAISIVCNRVLSEHIEHAFKATLAEKKKIVHSVHLFADGVADLPLYPLISSLPTFAADKATYEAAMADAKIAKLVKEASAAAVKAWRADHPTKRKKATAGKKKVAEEATTEVAEPAEVAADEPAEVPDEEATIADETSAGSSSPASFAFYIGIICKNMKEVNPDYAKIRVSSEFRETLSALAIELINRLGRLVIVMTESMNIKTVNSDAVLRVIEMLLIDNHAAVDTVELKQVKGVDPKAVEAEKAARKADPNYVKKPLADLPVVDLTVAERSTEYPTSAFASVAADVREKLVTFADAVYDHKLAAAEAKAAAAAETLTEVVVQ